MTRWFEVGKKHLPSLAALIVAFLFLPGAALADCASGFLIPATSTQSVALPFTTAPDFVQITATWNFGSGQFGESTGQWSNSSSSVQWTSAGNNGDLVKGGYVTSAVAYAQQPYTGTSHTVTMGTVTASSFTLDNATGGSVQSYQWLACDSPTSGGGYSPSEDEFLFLVGIVLFLGSIPMWERVFSVTSKRYDNIL